MTRRKSDPREAELGTLEKALGHRFADPTLLRSALAHSSLARRPGGAVPVDGFDRLEFLGDRVVGLVAAELLLARYPEDGEGDIARRYAALVNKDSLARLARAMDLGRFLQLSPGEKQAGGSDNPAVLADAFEAVVAALYRDGGWAQAQAFLVDRFGAMVEELAVPPQDAKTALQEWAQSRGRSLPVYRTLKMSGLAHRPLIEVEVKIEGLPPSTASGPSRRAAEQAAAAALLERARREGGKT